MDTSLVLNLLSHNGNSHNRSWGRSVFQDYVVALQALALNSPSLHHQYAKAKEDKQMLRPVSLLSAVEVGTWW